MNYIEKINKDLISNIKNLKNLTLFGQNIDSGSFLSGLTKNINNLKNAKIINSTNCENTLVGFGFGLALKNQNAIYVCKQQDFLLLTMDQIVNTYNSLRIIGFKGSFSIITIIVDSGYEGPQSRLNNLSEFSSLANLDIWNISTNFESMLVNKMISKPGFRLICVSQKNFRIEIPNIKGQITNFSNKKVIQYLNGSQIAIICFNFSIISLIKDINHLDKRKVALYNVINHKCDFEILAKRLVNFKKILILDDSRSEVSNSILLSDLIKKFNNLVNIKILKKRDSLSNLFPNKDNYDINIISEIRD
tara:strand:+ start:19194 stop:20108 length:915 start_codon:yes stop_codon:yes gene_type:complete